MNIDDEPGNAAERRASDWWPLIYEGEPPADALEEADLDVLRLVEFIERFAVASDRRDLLLAGVRARLALRQSRKEHYWS